LFARQAEFLGVGQYFSTFSNRPLDGVLTPNRILGLGRLDQPTSVTVAGFRLNQSNMIYVDPELVSGKVSLGDVERGVTISRVIHFRHEWKMLTVTSSRFSSMWVKPAGSSTTMASQHGTLRPWATGCVVLCVGTGGRGLSASFTMLWKKPFFPMPATC